MADGKKEGKMEIQNIADRSFNVTQNIKIVY